MYIKTIGTIYGTCTFCGHILHFPQLNILSRLTIFSSRSVRPDPGHGLYSIGRKANAKGLALPVAGLIVIGSLIYLVLIRKKSHHDDLIFLVIKTEWQIVIMMDASTDGARPALFSNLD